MRLSTAATALGRFPRVTPRRIDPNAWKIVDGKLYLNYNKSIKAKWENDIPDNISKADTNWPGLLAK
jgi:hypothetical protein